MQKDVRQKERKETRKGNNTENEVYLATGNFSGNKISVFKESNYYYIEYLKNRVKVESDEDSDKIYGLYQQSKNIIKPLDFSKVFEYKIEDRENGDKIITVQFRRTAIYRLNKFFQFRIVRALFLRGKRIESSTFRFRPERKFFHNRTNNRDLHKLNVFGFFFREVTAFFNFLQNPVAVYHHNGIPRKETGLRIGEGIAYAVGMIVFIAVIQKRFINF